MVDFVIIDVIFTIVIVRFCGPARKFRTCYLEHTLRGLANAARNKGMYVVFSTFFAEIFPYPTNIVQIINNRMMQSLHSLCDHPSD